MNILNKQILNSYSVLLKEDSLDDFYEWYGESLNNEYGKIINEYFTMKKSGEIKHMSWNVIPISRLKKIWEDFSRTGIVRDERGVEAIKDQMLDILIRLEATTNIAGHGEIRLEEIFESLGFDEENEYVKEIIDDNDFDFFNTFLSTDFEGGRHQNRVDKITCY